MVIFVKDIEILLYFILNLWVLYIFGNKILNKLIGYIFVIDSKSIEMYIIVNFIFLYIIFERYVIDRSFCVLNEISYRGKE